jgi:hypothetical protein
MGVEFQSKGLLVKYAEGVEFQSPGLPQRELRER